MNIEIVDLLCTLLSTLGGFMIGFGLRGMIEFNKRRKGRESNNGS